MTKKIEAQSERHENVYMMFDETKGYLHIVVDMNAEPFAHTGEEKKNGEARKVTGIASTCGAFSLRKAFGLPNNDMLNLNVYRKQDKAESKKPKGKAKSITI